MRTAMSRADSPSLLRLFTSTSVFSSIDRTLSSKLCSTFENKAIMDSVMTLTAHHLSWLARESFTTRELRAPPSHPEWFNYPTLAFDSKFFIAIPTGFNNEAMRWVRRSERVKGKKVKQPKKPNNPILSGNAAWSTTWKLFRLPCWVGRKRGGGGEAKTRALVYTNRRSRELNPDCCWCWTFALPLNFNPPQFPRIFAENFIPPLPLSSRNFYFEDVNFCRLLHFLALPLL